MTKSSRLSFLRARALALRVVSFASIASPSVNASVSPSVSAHSLSSPSLPYKSAHVWRKTAAQDDTSEALPAGFVPAVVPAPFIPAIDKEVDAEIAPIAYAEALPEIGEHNLRHAVNCMLIALPWRA